MKRTLLFLFACLAFSFASAQIITPPDYNICDTDTDGSIVFDLSINNSIVLGALSPNDYSVTYYLSQNEADAGVNPLPPVFTTFTNPQIVFVRLQENANPNNYQTTSFSIFVNQNPQVNMQTFLVCDTNGEGIAMTDLTILAQQIHSAAGTTPGQMEISFYETTNDAVNQVNPLVSIYFNSTPFQQTIYAFCEFNVTGCWTIIPIQLIIDNCMETGEPVNLSACYDDPPSGCFDLTTNETLILNALNPADYTITYHLSSADAANDTAAIANPANYCVTQQSTIIYVRFEENATGNHQIFTFALTLQSAVAGNATLQPIVQCDEDNNDVIIVNLTSVAAQLNTTNNLTFYTNSTDAMAGTNAIVNATAFSINVATPLTFIFIREEVVGGCDIVNTIQVNALANCNIANVCAGANSLCNSLGNPFNNTVNNIAVAEPWFDYGCLGTQPNPTWFYIPVSQNGAISLLIEQNTSINFNGGGLDVDFICYGPFANPVTPCSPGQLNASNTVACSYSAAPIENAFIPNAQIGQFYLLMVTNFSNQPGFIKITETAATQGEIDCTGLRLNAFLDSNSNGIKDGGEQNFPLGQFTYEVNNDTNVHNISSPTGIYSIYEMNPANSYDLGFAVDGPYAANYSVTTASYSDVSVIAGAGMQNYYFPVIVTQDYNDLAVTIIPNQAPRPGFTYSNKVMYTNYGTQTVASGTITFTKDALVTITGNSEVGAVNTAMGFTYNFTNLLPFESREITVTMLVPNIPVVALGNLLTNTAEIIPLVGDVSPENNSSTSSQVIIGAYDPNDKMESRGGQILITDFTNDDYLYYTVRFENTGNASAINVRITDIMDDRLNEGTLMMLDASHDFVLDRLDNQLTWRFDNIQLPPSAINPAAGRGYVHFKVKPNPGYAVGDIIPNTASIFFDFNPAIVTNTFNTEFVSLLSTNEFENDGFVFYPNPAGDIVNISLVGQDTISSTTVYDMLGKVILSKKSNSVSANQTIDISAVSSGIYFLEVITGSNVKTSKKLIVK